MRSTPPSSLPIDLSLLKPGLRLAVGVSGGADSVALLRALAAQGRELGLVLHVAHLHHGLRGQEADDDLSFVRNLAAELGLPFHEARVDTTTEARARTETGKPGESAKAAETIEEAARRLRYGWFRQLLAAGEVDAVATAHTRDDQAETVLAKFLRGAWTEGLSGIHPVVEFPEGRILRPLLNATRTEVEAYLAALGQLWREDSSNRHPTFTRNRIRHELLPLLETWNPRLREHLAQMAALARDEEEWPSSPAWPRSCCSRAARCAVAAGPRLKGWLWTSPAWLRSPRLSSAAFCAIPPSSWAQHPILPPRNPFVPWPSTAAPDKNWNWPRASPPSELRANCAWRWDLSHPPRCRPPRPFPNTHWPSPAR
jgi:tRNA(Ile)-lysidine synthetase-like protein